MADTATELEFNAGLRIAQVRIARPTRQLDAVTRFYRDGLGLAVIGSFAGHAGYDGVMFGLPGSSHHLEFTQHHGDNRCGVPAPDNLLVFYVPDAKQRQSFINGWRPSAPAKWHRKIRTGWTRAVHSRTRTAGGSSSATKPESKAMAFRHLLLALLCVLVWGGSFA